MIELVVLNGPDAGTTFRPASGPLCVGRGSGMTLRVSGPGVWDHHFDIEPGGDRRMKLRTAPGARVAIDDQFVEEVPLRNGTVIVCGGVRLRFGLTPTTQRPLARREVLTWAALGVLLVFEALVLQWISR